MTDHDSPYYEYFVDPIDVWDWINNALARSKGKKTTVTYWDPISMIYCAEVVERSETGETKMLHKCLGRGGLC